VPPKKVCPLSHEKNDPFVFGATQVKNQPILVKTDKVIFLQLLQTYAHENIFNLSLNKTGAIKPAAIFSELLECK